MAKPNFKNTVNTAMAEQKQNEAPNPAKAMMNPEPEQPVKKVKERKSKRLQLLVYPSVYDSVKKTADAEGESVNEIINAILKEHFEKE